MKWNLKGKTTSQGLIAPRVLAQGSIPVLLVATGRAVSFVSDTGESIDAHPHVTVSLGESWTYGPDGSDVCVTHYFISAYGAAGRARNLVLPVLPYQNCAPLRTGAEIQALIDGLAPKIAEAVAMCGRLDEIFADAERRMSVASHLKGECNTRTGYESACAKAGVAAFSDQEITSSYGVDFGDFGFPEYSPETVVQIALARHRKTALEAESKSLPEQTSQKPQTGTTLPTPPLKTGQLWEPCICGNEPVYMPLHLCANCWPKS